jgi:hypothetical protein
MITSVKIEQYWDKRHRFEGGTSKDIDWISTGQAMVTFTPHKRREVTKHVSGFCGVNKQMHRWGRCATNMCPRCQVTVEDAAHVWICPHQTNVEVWDRSFTHLRRSFNELGTCPQLRDAVLLRLGQWSRQQPFSPAVFTFPGLQDALNKQDLLGWRAVFEGCWAAEWVDIQDCYFKWQDKRNSGRRWLVAIIQKLWDVAWDLWDQRNHHIHQIDTTQRDSQLRQDIQDEFSQGFLGLSTV